MKSLSSEIGSSNVRSWKFEIVKLESRSWKLNIGEDEKLIV